MVDLPTEGVDALSSCGALGGIGVVPGIG